MSDVGSSHEPRGIAVSAAGDVFVIDEASKQVVVYNALGHRVRSFATHASSAWSLALSASGERVYVADDGAKCVRELCSADGTLVRSFGARDDFGNGCSLYGIAVYNETGEVFVLSNAGASSSCVVVYSPDGVLLRSWPCHDSSGLFGFATAAATGDVLVADQNKHRVTVYSSTGTLLRTFGESGSAPGRLQTPMGIAAGASNEIFVGEHGNKRVSVFDLDGVFLRSWPLKTANLGLVQLAVAPDATVYTTSGSGGHIERFR